MTDLERIEARHRLIVIIEETERMLRNSFRRSSQDCEDLEAHMADARALLCQLTNEVTT